MKKVKAGDIVEIAGTYRCIVCGYKVDLKKGDTVPKCPVCGKNDFELWAAAED
jgi:rubrerythrin